MKDYGICADCKDGAIRYTAQDSHGECMKFRLPLNIANPITSCNRYVAEKKEPPKKIEVKKICKKKKKA